jgi:hypothetical protein
LNPATAVTCWSGAAIGGPSCRCMARGKELGTGLVQRIKKDLGLT